MGNSETEIRIANGEQKSPWRWQTYISKCCEGHVQLYVFLVEQKEESNPHISFYTAVRGCSHRMAMWASPVQEDAVKDIGMQNLASDMWHMHVHEGNFQVLLGMTLSPSFPSKWLDEKWIGIWSASQEADYASILISLFQFRSNDWSKSTLNMKKSPHYGRGIVKDVGKRLL